MARSHQLSSVPENIPLSLSQDLVRVATTRKNILGSNLGHNSPVLWKQVRG